MRAAVALALALLAAHPDRLAAARRAAGGVASTRLLLAVALVECGLGTGRCRPVRDDGGPVVWPHPGGVAEQARRAAVSLRHRLAECSRAGHAPSLRMALDAYHTGSCTPPRCARRHRHRGPYADLVLRAAAALAAARPDLGDHQ